MSALKTRLNARLSTAQKLFREHVIALACYRGRDDDPLSAAYKDVIDSAGRRVLLAVFASVRQINEAAYYQQHSALADSDATEQTAQAQIREARENCDKVLDNIVNTLRLEVPRYIEEPLAMVASEDAQWGAGTAIEGLAGVAGTVMVIRELCDDLGNEALHS